MRKATMPVLDKAGKTIIPVQALSAFAVAANGTKGVTAARPASPPHATPYYDTDLTETVYYNRTRTRWENHVGDAR